jgi:gliding motility-associated-like protein
VHTYQNGGAFNVSVTAYLNGQTQASTQPLNITNFDTQINLVQDTTACSCQLPYSKKTNPPSPPPACALPKFTVTARVQGSGTPQLQWYGPSGLLAGQTTATLTPDSAGYYYLVATVGGCSTYAGVNIKEYGIQDQRANIWYFGNDAGIDFNPLPDDPAKPISNPVMNAPEGTSTISDRNGQVIFFTDGETVWNRQFQVVDTGIGGDQDASQSALIMPVQGDETLYYIFTTQSNPEGGYDLRYSLFDLKLNGGLGGLVQKNVLLFSKSTERITGNANWLIAHEAGNNSFRAYKVTADGIGAPVISSIGSDHQINVDQNGEGYMKLGSKNMLAVALSTPGVSNKIEVFDFADSTGKITNFRTADLKNANGQVYGVEFSPGSNKLYATLQGSSSSQIYEFAFDSLSRPYLKKPPIAPVNEKLGAIQTGPDGQVYVAVDGKQFLGTIQVNEDTTKVSNFTLNGFGLLSGTNSRLGLPNFIQTISDPQQGPGIAASGFCLGDSTSFSGTGTDQIDQFQWFFGDGQGSTLQSVKHVYAAAGTYLVSLRITNRCGLDTTLTQSVTIVPPPAPPTFLQAGQNPVLCNGPLTLEATPATNPDLANLHFAWSTGDTTRTIVVTQQNIYSVTITNKQGCTSNGSLPIADNRPVVELGPNQTICQNISLPPLDAQNPGSNYSWTINGVVVGNSRTQSVDTSVPSPPTYEYEVTVTDPTFGCVAKDSVIYTINPAPVFNVSNITNSNCGAATGSFQLNITGPTGTLFSYFITGPSPTPSGVNQSIGSITPLNLAAGTYGITVTDQVSGCPTTSTASINDNTFTVNGTQNGTCDPININVSVSAGAITPIKYRVIDKRTLQVVQPTTPNIMSLNFSTNNLSSNNQHYVVEVTDNGGCVASDDDVLLNHNPKVAATLSSNVCSTPITVTATGGTGWTWTGPNITSAANIASISAAPPAGSQTYNVTITDGVNCPLDTAITVDVQTPSTVALAQTDACADQVTVSANVSPSGSYLYRWSRNGGAPDPSLGGPQVIATKANDGQIYTVSIYNTINGCNTPSNPLTVQVDGTLSVTLATTTACEGLPFTLTATPSRSVSTYAWALGNAPISGQTTNTLTVQDGKAGTYSVTATEASCKATASINIIVAPVTEGNLSSRIRICPDPAAPKEVQEAVLNPGTFQTYNWFKNGVSLGITTPTLTVSEGGKYTVDLVNNFGCPSKDQSEVVEECDPVITGPNAFRPSSTLNQNGDYVNQTFRLFTFFIDDENFSIFIFNRWGEMVYKSEDRQFRWNGGYNNNSGQLLPAGTYSYVVRYKSSYRPELGIQEKRGGVVLLR